MTQARSTTRRWWAPASIAAIALAMIAIVVFSNNDPAAPAAGDDQANVEASTSEAGAGEAAGGEPQQRIDVERHDPDDPLAVGQLNAPVTIVAVSDFGCGFCALWSTQTLPSILEYVEAGDVRIEWRDVALFGPDSQTAAVAAYAAGEQGEYLAYSQALFAGGSIPDGATLSDEGLEGVAAEIGLDVEKFRADRAGETVAAGVQDNIDEATALGVSSTPSFLINGRPLVGAQPAEVFLDAINEELATHS